MRILEFQVAEALASMLTGVTFYRWIFCFHVVKALMPSIVIIVNFGSFVKKNSGEVAVNYCCFIA